MSACVVPGSFDPLTRGHLDVVERAARLFDRVVVAVMHNPNKAGTFAPDERVEFFAAAAAHLPAVEVRAYGGRLLVDVCRDLGVEVVVKGLRGETDFGYELPMATMNRALSGLETLFLPGDPALGHLSSSLVKQVAALGGDVTGMVPAAVIEPLLARVRG